jgi:hypothetical protein
VSAPRGHHQQRLGLAVPALGWTLDEQLSDFLGARCAAGLARTDRRLPGMPQTFDQELGVRRFARALAAFERDEPAPAQRLPQTR